MGRQHRTTEPEYRRKRARCLAPDPLFCALCGEQIDKTLKAPHPRSAVADHIDPVSRGGHNLGPLQPAHKDCNEKKYNKTAGERRRSDDAHALPW